MSYLWHLLTSSALIWSIPDTFDGKVFISTFSGEVPGRFLDATASLEESNAKWSALFERIKTELGLEVYFAPNWNDVKTVSSNTWSGGHLFWEAWAPKGSADDLTLDTANSVNFAQVFER